MRLVSIFASLCLGFFLLAPQAHAACLTCSCTVTANPLAFGAYAPLNNAPLDGAGEIDIDCFGLTTALDSITLKLSAGGSGSFAARRMLSGANTLSYNIYSDAARSIVWGDGTGGSSSLTLQNQFSLLSWSTSAPVYGRIAAAPGTRTGNYADTIIVTVEW